jgi:hypothetical protein
MGALICNYLLDEARGVYKFSAMKAHFHYSSFIARFPFYVARPACTG